MDQAQLHQKIDELSDAEAERCLQVLIKGFAVRYDYEELVASEEQLQDVIRQYHILAHKQKEIAKSPAASPPTTAPAPAPTPITIKPSEFEVPEKRKEAVRAVLHAVADDDQLRPALDSWFDSGRPTLLDPITTGVVLAGIVFVLSADIRLKAKKGKDGKIEWQAEFKKSPTKESLLGKFFGIFK